MEVFTQDQLNQQIPLKPVLGKEHTVKLANPKDTTVKGLPTTSPLAFGDLIDTSIDSTNNALAHACDFILDMKKSMGLKKFLRSVASKIREGIRAILRALGVSDLSGQYTWLVGKLNALKEDLDYVMKEWIQPIIDFEKEVLVVIGKINEVIKFILSLPAKILAMLNDCLNKLYDTIKNIMLDALAEAAKDVPLGAGSDQLDAAFKGVKESVSALSDGLQATVGLALTAAGSSVSLISPTSTEAITSAGTTLQGITSIIPTTSIPSGSINSLIKPTPTPIS